MEQNVINKFKLLMEVIRWFPLILALLQFLNIITQFFGNRLFILSQISGLSLLPLIFFYLCSYVFKFCFYHRVSLHYITITQLLCLFDTYIGIPITTEQLFYLHISLFVLLICNLIYFKFIK